MGNTTTTRSVELGRVVMTRGVAELLDGPLLNSVQAHEALRRHARGDWGDVCDEDKAANDAALEHGERLLSSYRIAGVKVWIITEWDRSVTTLLLPDEY